MALSRRTGARMAGSIWPGFVDAMTALLLVLMFVLSIFMIVQSVLRDTITMQDDELDTLTRQLSDLADALGLERVRSAELEDGLAAARGEIEAQGALIATLQGQIAARDAELGAAAARIAGFEEQVLALIAERDAARGESAARGGEIERLLSDAEAMQLALATARDEIDAAAEAARLDAARREALEALIATLRSEKDAMAETINRNEAELLVEAAAAAELRERLARSDAELTAMTLALEEKRREAEETLTLLAAASAAREDLDLRLAAALLELESERAALSAEREARAADLAAAADGEELRRMLAAELAARRAAEADAQAAMTEAEERAALLATARSELAGETARADEAARRMALLNEQVAALSAQLASLQGLLDTAAEEDRAAKVQIENLGSQLNTALAQVAAEQKRRAEMEAAERARLEAEAVELERYRSDFFGKLREVIGDREGVRIVGDRFLFSSEVLFEPGAADLSVEGIAQVETVARTLREVADDIPPEIDWILRVDGHTDDTPLSGTGAFADNWALSQARALSVVRYLQNELGFPPDRLAATGFGEYRPVAEGRDAAARAQNRRIELKLTER